MTSKYEEINQRWTNFFLRYGRADAYELAHRDIMLLLKALLLAAKGELFKTGIDYPYMSMASKIAQIDYWLEQADKELESEKINSGKVC